MLQGPGVVVIAAAMFHAQALGHGDRHVVHIAAVPDRLEQCAGEAEGQDVLHRFLAQEVIDAEDLFFLEVFQEHAVQRHGRVQVVTEGLFHDHAAAAILGQFLRQELADGPEQRGWHGQVEDSRGRPALVLPQFAQHVLQTLVAVGLMHVELQIAARAAKPCHSSSLTGPRRENSLTPVRQRSRKASSDISRRSRAKTVKASGKTRSR